MYKFETENELELCRRITELKGEINRLNVIFEHNRMLNGRIVNALQTGNTSYLLKEAEQASVDAYKRFMDKSE